MNKKFRKLLSGIISSVGVMSSLVCPCAQAKWGEGTHAMTDSEFKAFYREFCVDALCYYQGHPDLKNKESDGTIDKTLDEIDKQNYSDLVGTSFSQLMGKYCEFYRSALENKNKFFDCKVFSFVVMDYFQRKNIKSAYLQIGNLTLENGGSHDVVIYEGKDGEWFVADLSIFFTLYYINQAGFNEGEVDKFKLEYGFKPTDFQYPLRFPLRDYIDKYAGNFKNCIFASENSGSGGYLSSKISNNDYILLPYWVKTSGACSKSFMDKFLLDEGVTVNDVSDNAKKLKFISPIKVVKDPKAQACRGNCFVVYKGINGGEVHVPAV